METEIAFKAIFSKLTTITSRPASPISRVWLRINPDLFQCKVTNRKLTKIQFLRFQDRIGQEKFIIEILK
jgi:hypothetical protein